MELETFLNDSFCQSFDDYNEYITGITDEDILNSIKLVSMEPEFEHTLTYVKGIQVIECYIEMGWYRVVKPLTRRELFIYSLGPLIDLSECNSHTHASYLKDTQLTNRELRDICNGRVDSYTFEGILTKMRDGWCGICTKILDMFEKGQFIQASSDYLGFVEYMERYKVAPACSNNCTIIPSTPRKFDFASIAEWRMANEYWINKLAYIGGQPATSHLRHNEHARHGLANHEFLLGTTMDAYPAWQYWKSKDI